MARGGGFPRGGMGGMGGGNMQQFAKQAQKLQQQMGVIQEEVENQTFEAAAGGGVVKATVNGKKELLSIKIAPDIIDPDDAEALEDAIVVAVNEALKVAADTMESRMGALTGGMGGLSGLF